jgi:hypothetical protein
MCTRSSGHIAWRTLVHTVVRLAYSVGFVVAAATACGDKSPDAKPRRYELAMEVDKPALAAELTGDVDRGVARIERFFQAPFERSFVVHVFSDRARMEAHWRETFDDPNLDSACWMIGKGAGSDLSILSPARWRDQSCGHDPDNHVALASFIAHELVHTYHCQLNNLIDSDNTTASALAWFVEGVAVFVSGQLEDTYRESAEDALRGGFAPTTLDEAISGKYRYGVGGSIVAYIDVTWGDAMLRRMLMARTPDELIGMLGIDEPTLLRRWRAWVEAKGARDGVD